MHYKNLLFDLDGTLTDPREGITRCVQFALAEQGVDEPDLGRLEPFIGPPLKQAFKQFYGFDEGQAERAVADYRRRFGGTGLYENRVYDGIAELLAELVRSGRRLYVATSKPWCYARQIIRHFRLEHFFCRVYGSEFDGTRTEKQALIAHLLREESLKAVDALMIGDRCFDIAGARHNGVAAAAVGYGYGSRHELMAEAPDYYYEALTDLRAALLAGAPAAAAPGAGMLQRSASR